MASSDTTLSSEPMADTSADAKAIPGALRLWVVATTLMFAVALALQWWNHAYGSELGSHPDESAHYVTGLAVHDYLARHSPVPPVTFVEQFYGHYPKVALGHWPPFFYVLGGVWSLVFSSSVTSILTLVALISAILSGLVSLLVARSSTWLVGLAAGLLFVASPIVSRLSSMVMADGLVALLMLGATLAFVRVMDVKEAARDSVLFGVLSALAFLTKGSAVALVLVPPLAIALSNRWDILLRKTVWLAPLVVFLVCAPWYWLTRGMQDGTWLYPSPRLEFTAAALGFYARAIYRGLGPLGTILAAIGVWNSIVIRRDSLRSRNNLANGLLALLIGVVAVACFVPAGIEERYLAPALFPLVFFAAQGAWWTAKWIGNHWPGVARYQTAFSVALLGLALMLCFTRAHKEYSGLARVANAIIESSSPEYPSVLIVSDASGEGMFVADMATRRGESDSIVIRGTKVLSDVNWIGTEYKSLCKSPREVVDRLDKLPINYVVDDRSVTPGALFLHQKLLEQAIADYPAYFQDLGSFNATRGGVQYPDSVHLYRFPHRTPPDRVYRLSLSRMARSDIEVVVPASRHSGDRR